MCFVTNVSHSLASYGLWIRSWNDTWINLDVKDDLANQDCSECSDPEDEEFEAIGSNDTDHNILPF